MNRKVRQRLIENLNNAFMDVVEEREGSKIARYVKKINRYIIDNAETITEKEIERLIESTPINMSNITDMFMVVSSITLILKEYRLNRNRKKSLAGIIALASMFNLNKVRSYDDAAKFARNVHSTVSAPKGPKYKKGATYLKAFKNDNPKTYNRVSKMATDNIKKAQMVSKLDMSKAVLRDYNDRVEAGEPREKIRYHLQRKYNSDYAVRRTVETEAHNQLETAKTEQGKDLGYTYKTWYTQSDPRVRDTKFHKQIHGQRVEIGEKFNAAGQTADHPGDMSLKPRDRINCRCYTILS